MAFTMEEKQQEAPSLVARLTGGRVPVLGKGYIPTARYEVERLSGLAGAPVIFTLTALPYGKVEEIRRMTHDVEATILLSGLQEPDVKDPAMKERFGGVTPVETLKHLLLPGEIADLSTAVERLTGYRGMTIKEVKNG